ncbi:MAG: DUF1491 family protein [Rhizobiales bacterium]|nr:DUF1491 family protein [Hyphomicrobiales bacterium]MBI3673711.1 DUF1491 family protein [Hyphomicrobiales bacterium]
MNLKSYIWVGAHLRRWQAEGLFATVIANGAAEAGAIFVIVNHLDGNLHLFGPAPGPAYDDEGARRFIEEIAFPASQESVDRLLARRRAADPDIWIVEVEDRRGTAGLSAVGDGP